MGVFYYFGRRGGRRGVHRDHAKAVEKSDSRSMELLGEIYARGYGVERNYSQAYEWFLQAANQKHYAAFNGIGYPYVKGRGVADGKNHTKVTRRIDSAYNTYVSKNVMLFPMRKM